MIHRITLVTLLFASSSVLMAQDIASASLRWSCNQTTDLRNGATTSYACAIITRGRGNVTWLQRNGQVATNYVVTATEGSWSDVLQAGQFTYLLTRDGKTGKLVVERTLAGVTLTLDFSESGDSNIKQKFHASEVAPEP